MSKIFNRKASFEYHFIKEFIAGLQLSSSEVKSLRNGNCSIGEGYCYIWESEIFLKNIFISKYYESTYNNHQEKRDRKLLLHKKEIREIARLSRENGITVIPVEIFLSNGRFKVKIAVAKGKKLYDKREDLKLKDTKREIERFYK
jgi:SsrA-binding protein